MVSRLSLKVKEIAERIRQFEDPIIVSHIDADGISSAAILYYTLEQLDKDPEVIFIPQLEERTIEEIPLDRELIFSDLGSGQIDWIEKHVIIDHHQPIRETKYQLNPHFFGIDGSKEISAAGLSYLVSYELIGHNKMAIPAIVGMVGDQIDRFGLKGIARLPLNSGFVKPAKGLRYYGRETKVLPIFLHYASDPYIPGLSGELNACYTFIESLGLDVNDTYNNMSEEDKTIFNDAIIAFAARRGVKIHKMFTEYFIFPEMPKRTFMRDASEFATALNATGRHDEPEIGMKFLLGENVYSKVRRLLSKHRKKIRQGLEELEMKGIEKYKNFNVFFGETIKPTVIGIVAGIAVSSRLIDYTKPIIAIAKDGDLFKISGRAPMELIEQGINLGLAMREAAEGIGIGGGHDAAAGAFVEEDKLEEFLNKLDKIIERQLKKI